MGYDRRQKAVELLKSILVVLLTLTAVGLVERVQFYSGASSRDWLGEILRQLPGAVTGTAEPGGQGGLRDGLRPVRIAVCNASGRYGIQYDDELTDAAFEDSLGSLLGEALAGAGAASEVSEQMWRAALGTGKTSAYYDFLGNVPLSALCIWLGGEQNGALTGQARRILLVQDGDSAPTLYYIGDDGRFYSASTGMSDLQLLSIAAGFTPNQAIFAFEQEERYENLDPYVMILPQTLKPMVYRASNPIAPEQSDDTLRQLLKDLAFHPQTSAVYQSADGQVVREGTDTLRISDDGTVIYHAVSGQDPRYPVGSGEETPGLGEIVETARKIAEDGLVPRCGNAKLYLIGTEQKQDGSTVVYFGYLLNGAAVRLPEDTYAARMIAKDGYISDYTLCIRAYQKTENSSAVLPELQAAAAMKAMGMQQDELLLSYLDKGDDQVTAAWTAE